MVIYTAIENNYDFLKPIPRNLKGIDFVCFSNTMKSGYRNGWKIICNPCDDTNPTKRARYVKINPYLLFPGHDCSLWIDGNIVMTRRFLDLISELIKSDCEMAVIQHPVRKCIYDEGEACVSEGKESKENWAILKRYLEDEFYPKEYGLVESNVLFRRHSVEGVVNHSKLWWSMIESYSNRDQLSFNFAAYRVGLNLCFLKGTSRGNNPAFFSQRHVNFQLKNIFYIAEAFAASSFLFHGLSSCIRLIWYKKNSKFYN